MIEKEKHGLETSIIDHRFLKKDIHGAIMMPVYAGAAFEFDSAESMEDAFVGRTGAHAYSRISNPTVEDFEQRVKIASEAVAVTALASGMAAISNTFLTIAYSGANIVTSPHLFGNTFSFFLFTLKSFGVEVRFCDFIDTESIEAYVDENTCAIFTEVITNPHMEVAKLKKISAIAQKKNVPFILDTTLVPWSVFKARHFGVDIEIVSSTKYISGGATSIGGLIVDHGTYDWKKSSKLNAIAAQHGNMSFNVKLRSEIFRNLGACMSPQVASMQSLGLETLDLRYKHASTSCLALASFLRRLSATGSVSYNGLPTDPYHRISKEQFGNSPAGAMLTFSLKNKAACFAFMNKLKVIRRATNLFDNKTLIIHPSSTIYGSLAIQYRQMVNVPDDIMRLSVGLENVEDIKNDILQAL
ncbi:O-acetylhomoserine sulfhydrylase [Bacteroidales bacterium]|nr:O-acetylhomoserine sulfhydrylase [Bacteroidales bacterium]